MQDLSYRTAIKRKTISRPLKYLISQGKIGKNDRILDYGCGRGDDIVWLRKNGYQAFGFDPYWKKNLTNLNESYDVVLCTYVLNVVNKTTRQSIIKRLKDLTNSHGTVYITVRRDLLKDHAISQRGTHQYKIKLPFEIMKKTSSYCIYKI